MGESDTKKLQELGAAIVQLIMLQQAPPKRAILAMLSVMLPTMHQEGFNKERALLMIGETWDAIVEGSFKKFEDERRHPN